MLTFIKLTCYRIQSLGLTKVLYIYSLADLLKYTPQRQWAASNARGLFIHKYPPLSVARYSYG